MIEDNVDVIVQWYDRFIESVRQIAMSAEEQKKKLLGVVVTDEIASDFSDIGMVYAKKLLECEWITQEQFLLAESIDEKFNNMSKKKELWTEKALFTCNDWNSCREMGRKLLEMLEK